MSDVTQMMADRDMDRPRVSEREIDRLMRQTTKEIVFGADDGDGGVAVATVTAMNGIVLASASSRCADRHVELSEGSAKLEAYEKAKAAARRELVRLETWRLQCMLEQPHDRFSLIVELRRLRYLLRRDAARRRDAKRERFAGNGSSPGR